MHLRYCQVRERYKGNVPECTYPDNRKTSIYIAHGCCDSGSGCCVSVEFSHAGVCNSAVALIGGALIAWINSFLLRRVFLIFEDNSENDETIQKKRGKT